MFTYIGRHAVALSMALTGASLFLPTVHAEPGGSGGGKVVVCYKDATKKVIKSVELLDLWEGERLPPYRKPKLSNASVESQVAAGIGRLKYAFDLSISEYEGEKSWSEMGASGIRWTTDLMLGKQADSGGWALDPIMDGKLPQTEDAYEQVLPRPETNCEIDQAIVYAPDLRRVRTNMRLIREMKKTHVAALYLHEGLYAFARSLSVSKEKSSIRVRRAISYVMSGNSFPAPPAHPSGEKYVECTSNDFHFETNFIIAADSGGLYVYTKKVASVALIGYNKNYLRINLPVGADLVACVEQGALGETDCQMNIGFYDSPVNSGLFWENTVFVNEQTVSKMIQLRSTPDHLRDGARDSFSCKLQTY